jgi:hypothetical protein
MAQLQPPPCQRLRTNHRFGKRMAVYRNNPTAYPAHRKAMIL